MTDLPRLFVHRTRPEIRPMDWTHMSDEACRQLDEDPCWKRVDRAGFEAAVDAYNERMQERSEEVA